MAFSNGLTSPRDEASASSNYTINPAYSSVRPIGSNLSSRPSATTSAERISLQRRFTTNAVPTVPTLSTLSPLSPIGQQRRQAAENFGYDTLQRKRRDDDLEAIRQRQRALQTEMALLNLQEDHLQTTLENEMNRQSLAGHQSEPTTPPEYAGMNGYSNPLIRPNRLSMASMTSLQSNSTVNGKRASRSGSTVGLNALSQNLTNASGYPVQSVPTSRRGSDEEEDDTYETEIPTVSRRKNVFNRLSMPVTSHDMRNLDLPDVASILGTGLNSIINDEEEEKPMLGHSHSKSMIDPKTLLRMDTTHDGFPVLRTNDTTIKRRSMLASSSGYDVSDVLDQSNGWGTSGRSHRAGQQSLPMNTIQNAAIEDREVYEQIPTKTSALNRRSLGLDAKYGNTGLETATKRLSLQKLQPSPYSTSDIPTIKSLNALSSNAAAPTLTHAEQHLQNHNASMGRIPAGANPNRLSRDLAAMSLNDEKARNAFASALQPGATPFGPTTMAGVPGASSATTAAAMAPASPPQVSAAQALNGYAYNANAVTTAMPQQFAQAMPYGLPYNAFATFPPQQQYTSPPLRQGQQNPPQDSQARVIAQRRAQTLEDNAAVRQSYKLEDVHGRVVELSKDQHGCRFLQRKIEDRDPEAFNIIFDEAKTSIVDLMTDPFGNYLCQKLLEFSDNERRTVLIRNAAPFMVKVALNQHGTRALQKMIEFIDSSEQIEIIIRALDGQVVTLIQDLNGNHVIQKCLNHLHPRDAQFIFDAVAQACLVVGTHRHGCCVLQRCIDHAAGDQKAELIHHITGNAYSLVQDPFGNYVVQYILDLNQPQFTHPLCLSFSTHMLALSRQKFSSNVIEKVLRVADPPTRRILVEELLSLPVHEIERLLRDNFANYVVQTAIDHADADQQDRLWEIVIPLLNSVRGTPCGRRLMGKLQAREKNGNGVPGASAAGLVTPSRSAHGSSNGNAHMQSPQSFGANGGADAFRSPQHPGVYNTPGNAFSGYTPIQSPYGNGGMNVTPSHHQRMPGYSQNGGQQPFSPYGRGQQNGQMNNVPPAMNWF